MEKDNETNKDHLSECSITLGDSLHERFEKHVAILKRVKPGKVKKREWLLQAFEEYMNEVFENPKNEIPKNKRVSFHLNSHFLKKLEKIIETQKKFRSSYSKKQWFVEAISRKLEREEELVRKHQEENESCID